MTRWWISWASTPRSAMRPCSSATAAWLAIASSSCRSSSENGVSRSTTSSPIVRPRQRNGSRTACTPARPSGQAIAPVLEHDRGAGRVDRLDGRLDDRLERLLEVERLRDGLRDPGERLELVHAPLRLRVQLRVLDRLRHLPGDRHQQVDLRLRERPRLPGADVERALELLAREDRDGEDRRVLVLRQVRERLEARVEMRVGGDHHRSPIGGGRPRDALAAPHPRRSSSASSTLVPCVARSTSSSVRSS